MKGTKSLKCFITTPFSEDFQNVRKIIADALRDIGIEPILFEETITSGTFIFEAVQQAIERADIIIADLTRGNPNVMYEVGYAHALSKPILFIVQRGIGYVPSDIGGFLYRVYEPSRPDELKRTIQTWVTRYMSKSEEEAQR